MVEPVTSRLVERNMTAARVTAAASTRPASRCPVHQCALEGGPVRWRCPQGHGVAAADIDRDYHPPAEGVSA